MKNILKKIIIFAFILPNIAMAVDFEFNSPKNSYKPGEQFYVDIEINPSSININGIEGVLQTSGDLKVVRIEDGDSIIKNWILKPENKNLTNFAGIIPNGFGGYINTPDNKNGLLFRVVLEAQKVGSFSINLNDIKVTKNDGQGTLISLPSKSLTVGVIGQKSNEKYVSNDSLKPEIIYEIVRDPNLYNGMNTLVFSASDNDSGVKSVWIKEGRRNFKLIQSPYLLEDQSMRGIIILRVSDNNNNEAIVRILPNLFENDLAKILLLICILVLATFVFYAKNKIKKNI